MNWDNFKSSVHKAVFPRQYAQTTEDLPLWYKCFIPHDGTLPYMIKESLIMLPDENGALTIQRPVLIKFYAYKGRRWFKTVDKPISN